MKNKKTYLVFIVQAYEERSEDGRLQDSVTLELIETSGEKAIEKSKKIINRKHYRIGGVIEKYRE